MVDIVKSKHKPYFQMHINTEHTLEEVDRSFSNFESYESFDAIKNEDREQKLIYQYILILKTIKTIMDVTIHKLIGQTTFTKTQIIIIQINYFVKINH